MRPNDSQKGDNLLERYLPNGGVINMGKGGFSTATQKPYLEDYVVMTTLPFSISKTAWQILHGCCEFNFV
jgi:hypothetical protein